MSQFFLMGLGKLGDRLAFELVQACQSSLSATRPSMTERDVNAQRPELARQTLAERTRRITVCSARLPRPPGA